MGGTNRLTMTLRASVPNQIVIRRAILREIYASETVSQTACDVPSLDKSGYRKMAFPPNSQLAIIPFFGPHFASSSAIAMPSWHGTAARKP